MASGNIAKAVGGWGTPSEITFPYTPTKDGMIIGYVAAQTSAASYLFINEDGTAYARGSSYGGSGYGLCFPARAGCAYAISLSANIGNQTFRFVPFR